MSNSMRIYAGLVCVVCLALLAGCAMMEDSSERPKKPGLYSLDGWNGAADNDGSSRWASDVNGEVGHRVYVDGPRASCRPSGRWNYEQRIAKGNLPPGMTLNRNGDITGTPTERGHWIVQLELYNVTCEGKSYKGFEQELRFHITGSGKVVQ